MEYQFMTNKGFIYFISFILSPILATVAYSEPVQTDQNMDANQSLTMNMPAALSKQSGKTDPSSYVFSQKPNPVLQQALITAADPIDPPADSASTEPVDLPLPEHPAIKTSDPLEGFNRVMFDFNDHLDKAILKPVATFYNAIMPKPLNDGVHNFYNNLSNIPTIANDVLQLHFHQLASDVWRLGINSTIGIGGLFDVASRMNLEQYNNDFGLTLARYGYTNSTYIVLPFFGPNTIRDGIGIPVDYFAFSVYPYVRPDSSRYELYGVGVIDKRAHLLQYQQVMEEAALDKYIFVRNAYLHRRAYQIDQNDHRTAADSGGNIAGYGSNQQSYE